MTAPIVMVHGAFCARLGVRSLPPAVRGGGPPGGGPRPPRPRARRRDGGRWPGLSMSDYAEAIGRLIDAQPRAADADRPFAGRPGRPDGRRASRVAGLILLAPSPPWGVTRSTAEEAISAVSLYALGPYWALAVDPTTAGQALSVRPAPARGAPRHLRAAGAGERTGAVRDPELVAGSVRHDHGSAPGAVRAPVLAIGRRPGRHPSRRHGARHGPALGGDDAGVARDEPLAGGRARLGSGGRRLPRVDRRPSTPATPPENRRTRPNRRHRRPAQPP